MHLSHVTGSFYHAAWRPYTSRPARAMYPLTNLVGSEFSSQSKSQGGNNRDF